MIEKDKKYIWHPYTPLTGAGENFLIDSAKGAYLYTAEGRKILDAVSSWWVNLHGHSNEYIADAISRQARKLEHVIFAGFTHEPAITLAERLLPLIPGEAKKIFYSDNGSTAVEVGLKMALQYWYNKGIDKKKIIALDGAFHGDTFGAMSVGERGGFTKPFNSLLFDVAFIDFPSKENEEKSLSQFEELAKSKDIAAFIYEPLVQGAAGMRMYSPEVLSQLMKIAKEYDILCIADEVMTGFGRTGKYFASSYLNIYPDIVCLSKGITGGFLPFGATTCTQKISAAFESPEFSKTFFHGHSYTGNPICCAAANASLDLLQQEECWKNISMIAEMHRHFRDEIVNGFKMVHRVECLGTILSIELKTTADSGYFNDMRKVLSNAFLEENILLRPLGNVVYILPPYCIQEEELNLIYRTVKQVLTKLF